MKTGQSQADLIKKGQQAAKRQIKRRSEDVTAQEIVSVKDREADIGHA